MPPPADVPGCSTVPLLDVAAHSATDAWAVGEAENTAMQLRTVIEHWNGRSWTLVGHDRAGERDSPGRGDRGRTLWAVGAVDRSTARLHPDRAGKLPRVV